jgi:hypothetical protein
MNWLAIVTVMTSLVAAAAPARAAEFYLVQDTATKRCQVVDQRPTSITLVVVGEGRSFATRAEAESAMRGAEPCRSGEVGPSGPTLEQPK